MEKKTNNKKILIIVLNLLVWVIVLSLVFVVVKLLIGQFTGKPTFFGDYSIMKIATGSMINYEDESKGINPNEYILIKKVNPKEIKEEDVITFVSQDKSIKGMLNTHRVKKIEYDQDGKCVFTTKGDNRITNPINDTEPVLEEHLVGKFQCKLLVVTAVMNVVTSIYFVLILIIGVTIISVGVTIYKSVKQSQKEEFDRKVQAEIEKLKANDLLKNNLPNLGKANLTQDGKSYDQNQENTSSQGSEPKDDKEQ